MKFTSILMVLAIPLLAFGDGTLLTLEEKLSDFNQLIFSMKSGYGPLKYKKEELGLDINILESTYKEKIKASKNNGEFYYLINQFIAEFKDGHFGSSVPTDHAAKVHFSTNLVNGKVLIETVDRKKLSTEDFPFEKGDEIVSVDGVTAEDFIKEYSSYRGNGFDLTSKGIAAYYITSRRGVYVPVPKKDKVVFEIRKGESKIIESVTLEWTKTGTPLDEYIQEEEEKGKIQDKIAELTNLSVKDYFKNILGPKFDGSYHCSGGTRIAIPKDATIIMKKPFVAYYHLTEKGNIGYLRIPHYSPVNRVTGVREMELRFSQYEYAVSVLEKNTVGLIIDQDHNCGGSVAYLEKILGLFMNKPYRPMDFKFIASKSEYLIMNGWLNTAGSSVHTLEYQNFKSIVELIKKHWLEGDFMTPMANFRGVKTLKPNHITYTKPILMLIDQMSGSGGDAFPSYMQGLGRAKLFGTRTMGLGGHVVIQPRLNFSGMSYRMTKSLFYRPDGVAVENNGAVPDVKYTITRDDFLYEYKGYQKAYLKALFEML